MKMLTCNHGQAQTRENPMVCLHAPPYPIMVIWKHGRTHVYCIDSTFALHSRLRLCHSHTVRRREVRKGDREGLNRVVTEQ